MGFRKADPRRLTAGQERHPAGAGLVIGITTALGLLDTTATTLILFSFVIVSMLFATAGTTTLLRTLFMRTNAFSPAAKLCFA